MRVDDLRLGTGQAQVDSGAVVIGEPGPNSSIVLLPVLLPTNATARPSADSDA